ncbi:Protein RALF-like 32 [Linum perenne]
MAETWCRDEAKSSSSSSSSLLVLDSMLMGGKRRYVLEEERAANKYITPGALKKDQPVCHGGNSGQSYSSSCLPRPSNPHTRGCSKYYRCRSDS